MPSSPKKMVVLHADDSFIKHLYAEHLEYKLCPSCSFTGPKKNNGQRKKKAMIISTRVSKFYHFFDPMMNILLFNRYAMYNKQNKIDVESLPTDHIIIVVHLIDILSDNTAAARPQLRIDKLEPRAVVDLNEAERKSLNNDLASKQPGEYLLPHLVSYTTPDEGYIWTSIRTNSYDFNPLIVGRVSQKALMGRIIAFAQGINEIAKGERKDLYDMIKKQMKEARKEKVAVPLRSLLQERSNVDDASSPAAATPCQQLNENDKENYDNENKIPAANDGTDGMTKKLTTTTLKEGINEDKKHGARKKNVLL